MKKSLIALAALAALGASSVVRARTHDAAFTYRMGAGFAGDVNRTHPFSDFAGLQDSTTPVRFYGDPALRDTTHNAWRGIVAGDASDSTAINIAGVAVRPYPLQPSAASNYGAVTLGDPVAPPTTGIVDFITQGVVMVKVRGTGTVNINSPVFIFAAANETGHVLGGLEIAAITGKTVPVANARFRGPVDANGITEMEVWPSTTIS